MKALIFEDKVVDVQASEFDVAPTMTWVDCDDTVQIGFSYDAKKKTFTSNLPTDDEIAKHQADIQAKKDLRASAKAKLIAGEKLTEEEANVLVGV
jgi:hypothetical protein